MIGGLGAGMKKKIVRLLKLLLLVAGLFLVVITFTPIDHWWADALSGRWNQPEGDVLVVLAGSSGADNVIGYGTYLRVQYALAAYQSHPFRKVVVSGGGTPIPQAHLMRQFLVCQGVPLSAIEVEDSSTTTRENAIYVKKLLGSPGKTTLLTSDYHMFRAVKTFQKAGLEVTPVPFPDVMKRSEHWAERIPAFVELAEESGKIVYYKMKGWI